MSATAEHVLTFTIPGPPSGGVPQPAIATTTVEIPCGAWTCITARDKRHTLRSTALLGVSAGHYTATFLGKRLDEAGPPPVIPGNRLVGGNANDDFHIDILDFGAWAGQYVTNFGTGNTTCLTPAFHSDFSGNGSVFTEDLTFISINFLRGHQANCCGQPGFGDGGSPVHEISIAQLQKLGLGSYAAGDVNGDGLLNLDDVAAVFAGNVPQVPDEPAPIGRVDRLRNTGTLEPAPARNDPGPAGTAAPRRR
jgi:hypothetical protein